VIGPDFLARFLASLRHQTTVLEPGQLQFETYWGFGRGYRRMDFSSVFFESDRLRGCPVWEIGAGANMAFRREVFEKVGLFDERLDVGAAGCSGDSEFWCSHSKESVVTNQAPWPIIFIEGIGRDYPTKSFATCEVMQPLSLYNTNAVETW
jgi:hypothetical protein